MSGSEQREILYEMIPMGNMIKVTAIDSRTGVEISIGGPITSSHYSLKAAARRRLEFVLAKKQKEQEEKGR
ncbi:MAG: hypothetical protein A2516_04525 [Alphaproteobacteria bacterium RIFOXYD12_FULL_60_8]|nr:MAG: hypothetical protein A2516_04525 [Alphaproteobacteria bacterium RIFOXYD12_FULL_60_8]